MPERENAASPVTIGLISDTHIPFRWKTLPPLVFEIFAGVDLILHAGDVGELWVRDELSLIAPIIAVHGNDETAQATQALPYLQTIGIAGQRIVLTHSHYPDRAEEMEHRKDDDWYPKLKRLTDFGKQHRAQIVVFGHSHIPMTLQHDGIWLVNPGAIASGSWGSRQKVQTVARMQVKHQGSVFVEHINLDEPDQRYTPKINFDAGFKAALGQFSESILERELEAHWDWLRLEIYPLAPEAVLDAIGPIAHRCWERRQKCITIAEVVAALTAHPQMPDIVITHIENLPTFAQYL